MIVKVGGIKQFFYCENHLHVPTISLNFYLVKIRKILQIKLRFITTKIFSYSSFFNVKL